MTKLLTDNLILQADSYKYSHWLQYPENTEYVSSYIESRGSVHGRDAIMMFGLQYFLKRYFSKPITMEDVDQAEKFILAHGLPFNRAGWEIIVNEYAGYMPLRIEALPEGMVVPTGVPMVQVINTDPRLAWLTSFWETAILRAVWYGSSVGTISWLAKDTILKYLMKSSDDPWGQINFKLHDFGARGVSSHESGMIGGAAHLVNFMGSDTVEGIACAMDYYHTDMCGFSIPAAEHSTMCAWGRENETAAFRNMLKHFAKPGHLLAVVSDTYNIWEAVSIKWGKELKAEVVASGALVVQRPDSGDPVKVPTECLHINDANYGSTRNKVNYKVLNSVRIIQGDGMNLPAIGDLCHNVVENEFSIDNIAMGMGGGLLQKVDRDSWKFAMKASAIKIKDQPWRGISKDPITDTGKRSKEGIQAVIFNPDTGRETAVKKDQIADHMNLLQPVWDTSKLLVDHKFADIRERSLKRLGIGFGK